MSDTVSTNFSRMTSFEQAVLLVQANSGFDFHDVPFSGYTTIDSDTNFTRGTHDQSYIIMEGR